MNVPQHLAYGSEWLLEGHNRRDLRTMLQGYGIKMEDCWKIYFEKESMTVYRYDTKKGRRFTHGSEIALMPPLQVPYRVELTPILIDSQSKDPSP